MLVTIILCRTHLIVKYKIVIIMKSQKWHTWVDTELNLDKRREMEDSEVQLNPHTSTPPQCADSYSPKEADKQQSANWLVT